MKASRWILGVAAVPLVWLTLEQRVERLDQRVAVLEQRVLPPFSVAAYVRSAMFRGDLELIAGREGSVNGQLRQVAEGHRHVAARSNHVDLEGAAQVQREADDLLATIESLPTRHDLKDEVIGRLSAAGEVLIHLMTIEKIVPPPDLAEFWEARIASAQAVVKALRSPLDSPEEAKHWDEAKRLLVQPPR